ncbi:MAG TPA: response regulator [Polyangiaceae bacterium]|nr:response regulator [Polyangiaceae bacterium]
MSDLDETDLLPPVLLVDDKPSNLLALEAVLSAIDIRTVTANSGREALDAIEREAFLVALVDVQMPEIDGFELTRRLRTTKHGREMPVILVTAIHRDEVFAREGYSSGAADYITKPYDPQVIRARVKAFIDLYRQRERIRRGQMALRTHERDAAIRRLLAFERISSAVLETNDVASLLMELLGAFLGAADAADSAAILLRDGECLRVAATVGARSEVQEDEPMKIGLGFAGVVAAERRPIESTGDAVRSVAYPPSFGSSLRALYGIPLLHAGQVLGVARIGSSRAEQFSPQEKQLLSAAAERASLAVAKQLELTELNEILEFAPACIAIVKVSTGTYAFANAAMRRLFRAELVGTAITTSGFGPQALKAIEGAQSTGAPVEVPELCYEQQGPNNQPIAPAYVRFTAQPLRNLAGMIDRVLVFALDITAQVEGRIATEQAQRVHASLLEREQAARRAAEMASTAKDEFLATVSHELRTPLSAILGWAAIARTRPDADRDRAFTVIERNARAQARIVDDVLDFSRIAKGKMRLTLRNVALRELVDSALESVRPAADAKDIQIDVELKQASPVIADAERLQQVIWNLLSNAVKFSNQGTRVSVEAFSSESSTTLVVRDQGQGIDPEFLPFVFEPFRQANGSTTRRHGGLGLGLAIVRQIVQGHGGTIEAYSEGLGRGATFTIELPRYERASRQPVRSSPDLALPANGRALMRLDGMRVLVIDDDQDSRELLEQALNASGAEVTVASSARDALTQLECVRPHVLVSDLAMPDTDGFELVRRIRALPPERGGRTPALALTAHTGKEASDRALLSGFQRYAKKPVDLDWFVATVGELGRAATEMGRTATEPGIDAHA